MLVGVPSYLVADLWPSVRPFIERSFEKTGEFRFNPEDVLEQILAQDAQLWVRGKPLDLVVVTEIYRHPRATELSIGPVAGELGEGWEEDLEFLLEWGRMKGCTHAGTLGRLGWARKLGWDSRMAYCARRLS